jgi:hypothetical protein
MKAFYAYFGLLDLHTIDSPGHSLYQLGLMDSIRLEFGVEKFDFFSYYPEDLQAAELLRHEKYPDNALGHLFTGYRESMIDTYGLMLEESLLRIKNKEYSHVFLKARFRNISTLTKKWKDAAAFEKLISMAIDAGYSADEIIILDTDLSLPPSFYTKYSDKVTVKIPSIDFKGISDRFLNDCVAIHKAADYSTRAVSSVFYGNINTSNYKSGNSKSEMLSEALCYFFSRVDYFSDDFTIIGKSSDFDEITTSGVSGIYRNSRSAIWHALEKNLIMLNVTKDKYNEKKFIPARIYEAMIFGMIPVSYKFNFLCETFSFNTIEDLNEIVQYLNECEPEDLKKAYLRFVKDYQEYVDGKHELPF